MQPTPITKLITKSAGVPFAFDRLKGAGPIIALVLLCIAGALLNPDFATVDNLMNVLTRTAFIGIIAVGMTFVIVSGGIDLSVGSMAALIAGAMIVAMNALAMSTTPQGAVTTVILGIALALVLGVVFGAAHGLLVTHGRIEPFIVTLGTLGIFRAVLTWLSDGGARDRQYPEPDQHLQAEIKKHPNIKILDAKFGNWNRDDAFKVMQDYLTRFKSIDAVWAADDDMAIGVIKALEQARRTDIKEVFGGAGAKFAVKKILDGDKLVQANVSYSPKFIYDAIRLTANARLNGQSLPAKTIVPSVLITRENAQQFYFASSPY